MSNIAPTVARQALRIASRRYPSSAFSRVSSIRRHYVSESKPAQATVSNASPLESAIKKEQRSFLKETGERAEDATMPTTGMGADAMMSPTAGELQCPRHPAFRKADTIQAFSSRQPSWIRAHGPST
jgi:cysteine desulfurase